MTEKEKIFELRRITTNIERYWREKMREEKGCSEVSAYRRKFFDMYHVAEGIRKVIHLLGLEVECYEWVQEKNLEEFGEICPFAIGTRTLKEGRTDFCEDLDEIARDIENEN